MIEYEIGDFLSFCHNREFEDNEQGNTIGQITQDREMDTGYQNRGSGVTARMAFRTGVRL